MKITDFRFNVTKNFGELETGDIFRDDDGDIMMKIAPYDDIVNCISLISGMGYLYIESTRVTPIPNAELIIR